MKKVIYIIAAVLCASACSDAFFERYPANTMTEGNVYKTEDDFNQGAYSCYAKLKTQSGYFITELSYRSDESELLSMAVSTQARYDYDHFLDTDANSILSNIWDAWYNGIYRCNIVLDHFKTTSLDVNTENMKKYHGEALFIRAWYYFNLYRVFGVVPIVTKVETPSDSKNIARCTDDEMLKRLEEDLTQAAELLPVSRSAEKGRVTRIAAQALLGKVYLTFKMYPEANAILEEALKDTGYGLEATHELVFSQNNKMGKEMIFALTYNKNIDMGHGYWHSFTTNDDTRRINPKPEFLAIFDKEKDSRYDFVHGTVQHGSAFVMKKWDDTYDATFTTSVGNDFPIIRYADITLMKAEALGLNGNIEGAIPYLNRTRTRAGLAPLEAKDLPTKDAFVKELADERGREFAFEGQRWFDLVRLGLAVDLFSSLGYKISNVNLISPVPKNQIEIYNNDKIFWQNPGY